MQLDVFLLTVVVCTGIFLATGGLLVYAVWRFRSRPGQREASLRHLHGNPKLEGALVAVVTLLLLIIAVPNLRVLFAASTPPADEEVLRIEAVGKQWWWKFTYPDLKVVTANELHIPVGRAVQLRLRSADVIHSFWVPKLAGKMDLIPNKENSMWFKAQEPGLYYGQCAEFCGVSHANMRFRVVVHGQAAFDAWVYDQRQPAVPPTEPLAQHGLQLFQQKGCGACHAISGTPAQADVGPDLTHVGSRQMLAAGLVTNTSSHLSRWLQNPQAVKPGSLMPNLGLNDTETAALVAYLQGLK
jgi:cytochrome c oxidase subunit 2